MAIIVWVAVPSCSYCLKLPSAPLSPLSLSPPNFKKMFDLAFVNYHLSIQPPKRMRLNAFLTTLPSPTNRVLKAHGCWFTEEQEIPYREEIVARFRIPEVGRCRLRNVPQKTPFIEREILVKIWWSTRKAKLWAQRTFFSRLSVSKGNPVQWESKYLTLGYPGVAQPSSWWFFGCIGISKTMLHPSSPPPAVEKANIRKQWNHHTGLCLCWSN